MAKTRKRGRPRFSRALSAAIDESGILGVRAGSRSDHRFTGIWPVVVAGRVFARSWTCKPDGWFRTFLQDPVGVIQLGHRNIRVRAVHIRTKRIWTSVERAYAQKYSTPASRKYVRGFRTPRRREATIDFIPR